MNELISYETVYRTALATPGLLQKISHNQLKKQLIFFTFGHSNHPNFQKKAHNSGPIPVLRKRTNIQSFDKKNSLRKLINQILSIKFEIHYLNNWLLPDWELPCLQQLPGNGMQGEMLKLLLLFPSLLLQVIEEHIDDFLVYLDINRSMFFSSKNQNQIFYNPYSESDNYLVPAWAKPGAAL